MKILALINRTSALTNLFSGRNAQKTNSNLLKYSIVLLFIVTQWGCGKGNPNAPVTIDPATNKHPVGWALNGSGGTHPDMYFAAPASCEGCHGKPSDPAGGISGVSCSNSGRSGIACHPSFPHVAGFAAYVRHGSVAKDVAIGVSGMAHCKLCHGSSYTGSGLAPSCIKCHNDYNTSNYAPHAANWVSGNANGLKHSTTNETNAPACAQCHLGGTYSHAPSDPAPAGTAPGCFNGTLCHNAAGHTFTVSGHQTPARSNLASCQVCHAAPASGSNPNPRFNVPKGSGVLSANGCEYCHAKPGIAHPYMWLPARGGSTTTSHVNAGAVNGSCGMCHGGTALTGGSVAYSGGIVPPSCFPAGSIDGTTCHFTKPVDDAGMTVGCGSCHGAIPEAAAEGLPNGTTAPNRAYRHTHHFSAANNLGGLTCSACHLGSGSPASTHATTTVFSPMTASVAFPSKFNESGLTAKYSPTALNTGKCENVSCHGGKITAFPAWKTTTVFNQAICTNCHLTITSAMIGATPSAYTGPYIGPFSGDNVTDPNGARNLHNFHAKFIGINTQPWSFCIKCHATPGIGHFADINSGKRLLKPGFAAATITGSGISVSSPYVNYNTTPPSSSCLAVAGCHNFPTVPRSWYK